MSPAERWQYAYSWVRDEWESDAAAIQEHLDGWASAGWELVSASIVEYVPHAATDQPSMMRHYFYWKRRTRG